MEVIVLLALVLFGLAALGAVLRLVFRLAFEVVLLPFKILGLVLKVVGGVVGVVGKLLFSVAGSVLGLVFAVVLLVVVPLLPFLLVGALVWLAVRRPRPHAVLRHTA